MGDDGRDRADGQTGELWAKTLILMQGCYNDPAQTAAAFHDGWFATGHSVQRAAIPVPSDLGEDEILIAIVAKPGVQVATGEIADWCRERLAAIKQPRYLVFVESLPVTATQRMQKFQLRGDGTLLQRAVDLERQ